MLFILEGPDGVGKTTQIQRLTAYAQAQGWDVVTTREPGGHPIYGQAIRDMLLNSGNKVDGLAELFGMMFDRALHAQHLVLPNLLAGKLVICDRMFESSLVYQGIVRGHGINTVQQLNYLCLTGTYADFRRKIHVVLLDGEDDVLEDRITHRLNTGIAVDKPAHAAGREFRQKVRDGYRYLFAEVETMYSRSRVDASVSLDDVTELLIAELNTAVKFMAPQLELEPRDTALYHLRQEQIRAGSHAEAGSLGRASQPG